jgi:hypothetical protein
VPPIAARRAARARGRIPLRLRFAAMTCDARCSQGWVVATRRKALGWGVVLGCAVVWAWSAGARAAVPAAEEDLAQAFARQVLASGDPRGLPFAVVDKHAARIVVHHADGRLAGTAPVLLGIRRGDAATPGVGQRTQQGLLRPEDLTTPAGRFASVPGTNHTGEAVIWIDHAAALALHRLRPGAQQARRVRALRSPRSEDKRLSAGCVVVLPAFYDEVVQPVLGAGSAVIYVLPEQIDAAALRRSLEQL